MKGGITSGVVYPLALRRLGQDYRFRGIGGASAGAIGAALGAAAELGRDRGGFDKLADIPAQLGDGRLLGLFQPQPRTRSMMRLLLAATRQGQGTVRKTLGLAVIALASHVVAAVLGALPGAALVAVGLGGTGWAGAILVAVGVLVALVGALGASGYLVYRTLTIDVPENLFGICRGMSEGRGPGFADWLCDLVDDVAGLEPGQGPLLFGDLWRGRADARTTPVPPKPQLDLRMMTTCLSQGRPYQLPSDARTFFYDPAEWATLFPDTVLRALGAAPTSNPDGAADEAEQAWEEQVAAAHQPPLRRLPDAEHLPVIVATRMSLSFPLLISAVPLYTVERRSQATKDAVAAYRQAKRDRQPLPEAGLEFVKLWFTDGGLCSNFPLHMFDAALPTRPTFAINLGRFPGDTQPDPDQTNNIEYARDNNSVPPTNDVLPVRGLKAVTGFGGAAVNTARNWQDGSLLDFPGYRDRIVRVLQTRTEGGLNLDMDGPTINGLSARGETAADALVQQFTQPRFPVSAPVATGWDNHKWVRFRALMSVLPDFLEAFDAGSRTLDVDPDRPPSYPFRSQKQRDLAATVANGLTEAAAATSTADATTRSRLTSTPRPPGRLRRVPTQ
jgi:predicted acylesterase/phospholipase RssA